MFVASKAMRDLLAVLGERVLSLSLLAVCRIGASDIRTIVPTSPPCQHALWIGCTLARTMSAGHGCAVLRFEGKDCAS